MKKKRYLIVLISMMLCILFAGMTASAGFRKMPNGKYRYYTSANKYLSGKKSDVAESTSRWTFKRLEYKGKKYTFCFDERGYMLTGIKTIYTNEKGLGLGWHTYRFANNGRLVGIVPKKGEKVTGKFVKKKKGTKFKLTGGTYVVKQWVVIKGNWYYFYSTGYMAKDTMVGTHFVDKNGRLVN